MCPYFTLLLFVLLSLSLSLSSFTSLYIEDNYNGYTENVQTRSLVKGFIARSYSCCLGQQIICIFQSSFNASLDLYVLSTLCIVIYVYIIIFGSDC